MGGEQFPCAGLPAKFSKNSDLPALAGPKGSLILRRYGHANTSDLPGSRVDAESAMFKNSDRNPIGGLDCRRMSFPRKP